MLMKDFIMHKNNASNNVNNIAGIKYKSKFHLYSRLIHYLISNLTPSFWNDCMTSLPASVDNKALIESS